MKTFIGIAKYRNTRFGQDVTVTVNRIKHNTPIYIGEVKFNTGSMMGVNHEVNKFLVDNNYLPKNVLLMVGI